MNMIFIYTLYICGCLLSVYEVKKCSDRVGMDLKFLRGVVSAGSRRKGFPYFLVIFVVDARLVVSLLKSEFKDFLY